MKNFFETLNIDKGDKVLVSSDILRMLMLSKKKENNLNPDTIIDLLKEKIGEEGTLVILHSEGMILSEQKILFIHLQ